MSIEQRRVLLTAGNVPSAQADPYDARMLLRTGLLSALVVAAAAAPAHAATTCDVSKDGRKLGATYVTALSATKLSCAAAKKDVKAYHACRRSHGGAAGRCTKRVKGFACAETRKAIPTEFSAKVRCSASGGRKLTFAYTQFT
jgi:hypothetical protein